MEKSTTNNTAILTKNLTVTYRQGWLGRGEKISALHALDLTIARGEIYGYLGPNGAGKTTTIKSLLGLIHPTEGEAHLLGQLVPAAMSRHAVGFLPENPFFYSFLTPSEAMHFFGRLFGLSRHERNKRMGELFDMVEITEIKDRRVGTFSKGQRQRFGLAQALINKPELVILDEPLSGLDPMGRNQFKQIIRKVNEDNVTVFFSSHILSDVQDLCTKVGLLHRGHLREEGTVDGLLAAQGEVDLERYFVERFASWDADLAETIQDGSHG